MVVRCSMGFSIYPQNDRSQVLLQGRGHPRRPGWAPGAGRRPFGDQAVEGVALVAQAPGSRGGVHVAVSSTFWTVFFGIFSLFNKTCSSFVGLKVGVDFTGWLVILRDDGDAKSDPTT